MDRATLEDINKVAFCGSAALSGGALIGTGVATLWAGGAGTVPLTLGALQLLGSFLACSDQEVTPNPNTSTQIAGCQENSACDLVVMQKLENPEALAPVGGTGGSCSVSSISYIGPNEAVPGARFYRFSGTNASGSWEATKSLMWPPERNPSFFIKSVSDAPCDQEWDQPPEPSPLPPGADDIQKYVDQSTNCTYDVSLLGFAQSYKDGPVAPVWKIAPEAEETRADTGGRMGGCNWSPIVYYGSPDTPGPIPFPDDGDWLGVLKNALGGALGNLLARALADLLNPVLSGSEYEFIAPCDFTPDKEQLSVIYQLPSQKYQSRVVSQLTVLQEMLQQHLNWKTPICFGHDPGTYKRSITFASCENTDNGNRRCTKRFGYRSNSPCTERQLFEHWRLFEWDTGPVVVQHSGSALGSPQVWATSIDEGKRVIHHAGREAGVDPDQVGEWSIGGSDNPRYGVSHTVKLMQVRGLWQATQRKGSNGYATAYWSFPDSTDGN